MEDKLELSRLLPILLPFILIQLILMVIALVQCIKSENTRGPKLMWLFIIILGNLVGPIAFFILGRKNE